MKRTCKKVLSGLLALAMVFAYTPASISHAAGKVTTKQYTLSKKAGTYQKKVKVKLTVKKGFKVYYTTGKAKMSLKNVVKSGKSKTWTFQKTTSLKLYAAKETKAVTAKTLTSKSLKTKTYKYQIKSSAESKTSATPKVSATSKASAAAATTAAVTSAQPQISSGAQMPVASGADPQASSLPNANTSADPNETADVNTSIAPNETADINASADPNATEDVSASADPNETADVNVSADPNKTADVDTSADPNGSSNPDGSSEPDASSDPDSTDEPDEKSYSYEAEDGGNIEVAEPEEEGGAATLTITKGGTYRFKGLANDLEISVASEVETDEVKLVLEDFSVDNSALTSDNPVIYLGKNATNLTVVIKGANILRGPSAYQQKPASALLYAASKEATVILDQEAAGSLLTVTDSISQEDAAKAEEAGNDPTDGIASKGKLVVQDGSYSATVNGDGLKGTGGVTIEDGKIMLATAGDGIKSKNGNIVMNDGDITSIGKIGGDGIQSKKGTVEIKAGSINFTQCYGDGIQGEEVKISGGTINITTLYDYAGKNFYDKNLGQGAYNIITTNTEDGTETKTEIVNLDTGSHAGIKGGTKASTYSYAEVGKKSEYTAGEKNTATASGGVYINGGTITIDTTKTGARFASDDAGAAYGDQWIIGAPDDGIKSANELEITGGDLTIKASGSGLSAGTGATIQKADGSGYCNVNIKEAYQGIEAPSLTIGTQNAPSGPNIFIYSTSDAIKAAKTTVDYAYANEDEETYTKTVTYLKDEGEISIYSGYVNATIADDDTWRVDLPLKDSEDQSFEYSAGGYGIFCNGTLEINGTNAEVIINGASGSAYSPVKANTFSLKKAATFLQMGGCASTEPTEALQNYLAYSATGASPLCEADTPWAIKPTKIEDASASPDVTVKSPKAVSYIMFSSTGLKPQTSYDLYTGGSCEDQIHSDDRHDYRYRKYTPGTIKATELTKKDELSTID